jgi:hypothetical protein
VGGGVADPIHYEPIPQSRSQRQTDRDNVKLAAEEEQRHRRGFRIGARHRRAQADVVEREAELVRLSQGCRVWTHLTKGGPLFGLGPLIAGCQRRLNSDPLSAGES